MLGKRIEQHLLRTIPAFESNRGNGIDLSTNSYLALQENHEVSAAAQRLVNSKLYGNLASRLISEHSPLFTELEKEISEWKNTESALVFNSGYAANIGVLQAICTRDTEVFSDRFNHASIIDGIQLSGCRLSRYRHLDMADLRNRLKSSKSKEKLIITDTVFSMDGDRAPLPDICELAGRYNCMVMVDEAHATGIFGESGSGLVERLGVAPQIDIRIGTFSKALAGLGGFFAGSAALRLFFVNLARSLIYSTALPNCVLAHNLAAVRYIRENANHLGKQLTERADDFRAFLFQCGFGTMQSTTQIVPCIFSNEREALELASFLKTRGIFAPAIRPPTVPPGTARVRFSLHLGITSSQQAFVHDALREWSVRYV